MQRALVLFALLAACSSNGKVPPSTAPTNQAEGSAAGTAQEEAKIDPRDLPPPDPEAGSNAPSGDQQYKMKPQEGPALTADDWRVLEKDSSALAAAVCACKSSACATKERQSLNEKVHPALTRKLTEPQREHLHAAVEKARLCQNKLAP